jgi:hypothetical protein
MISLLIVLATSPLWLVFFIVRVAWQISSNMLLILKHLDL